MHSPESDCSSYELSLHIPPYRTSRRWSVAVLCRLGSFALNRPGFHRSTPVRLSRWFRKTNLMPDFGLYLHSRPNIRQVLSHRDLQYSQSVGEIRKHKQTGSTVRTLLNNFAFDDGSAKRCPTWRVSLWGSGASSLSHFASLNRKDDELSFRDSQIALCGCLFIACRFLRAFPTGRCLGRNSFCIPSYS